MVDQPSQKSYKIRTHTRQRKNSKPYSRPIEPKNKGLLDTVRDYLSPTWLFGYFTSSEDQTEPCDDEVLDDNTTVTHEEGSTSSATSQDRLPSIDEENESVHQNIGDNREVFDEDITNRTRLGNADLSIRLSGSLNDDIEDENEQKALGQQESSNHSILSCSTEQLKRKPLPSLSHRSSSASLLLQRRTPRSQMNSFLGSSRASSYTPSVKFSTPLPSSGASHSSIRQRASVMRPGSLLEQDTSVRGHSIAQDESSKDGVTARAAVQRNASSSQPTSSSSPLFSVEKFVTPVQRTFTNKRVGSPSYPGPVMFGGAMNVSHNMPFKRRRTSHSPGSESYHPVSKLRIQGVKGKTIQNSTLGGTSTRTAQRILDALESVSSPLQDVRRIPSPISMASVSPLSFMPSKKRSSPPKTKVGPRVSYLQARLLGEAPPVSSLQTPEVARVSFVEHAVPSELKPRSPSPPPSSKTSVDDQSFFSGLKDTVCKSSLPASFAPKSLPTSLSPIQNTSKSSGKMKTASRSSSMHYSANRTEENEVVNPLPEIQTAVPLPLNPAKSMSLPMFNTNKNDEAKTLKKSEESSCKNALKNGFIFSTPEPKSKRFSVKEALEIADDGVSFSFSQPLPVMKSSSSVKQSSKNLLLQAQKTSNIQKATTNNSPSKTTTTPFSESPLSNKLAEEKTPAEALGKLEPAQPVDLAQRFAPVKGSWKCETAKPETEKTEKSSQEIDLKAKFRVPKDSWKCEVCLIANKLELDKCAACETKRPGSSDDLKSKFAAPSGSWECPTCMIQNKMQDLKCVACETNKPGASNDLKQKFASPSGSWECSTCLVRNKESDLKCVACATSKPGNQSSVASMVINQSGFTLPSGFQFGTSSSSSEFGKPKNDSPFTFGQSSAESSTNTFGSKPVTAASDSTSNDLTGSALTTTGKASFGPSGFSFGGNSFEKTATQSFTFGAKSSKEEKKSSQFNLGNQDSDEKTDGGKNIGNEKTSAAPTMNIAQAAAAGLLKVPSSQSTIEPAAITPFKFGAATVSSAESSKTVAGAQGFPALSQTAPPHTSVFSLQTLTTSISSVAKTTTGLFTFGAPAQLATVSAVSSANSNSPSLFSFTGSTVAATTNNSLSSFAPLVSTSNTVNSSTPVFNFTGSTSAAKTTLQSNPSAPNFSITGVADKSKPTSMLNFGTVNGPTSSTSTPAAGLFSFTGTQAVSAPPVTENSNSMGGEEMDADSNNNHDQTTFLQNPGFNFSAPATANTSGIFGTGSRATPGNSSGGFNFAPNAGMTTSFQFGKADTSSGGFNFVGNAAPAGSAPFMFEGSSTSATGQPSSISRPALFNFGGNAAPPAPSQAVKSQFNVAPGSEQPALFNIGATSQPSTGTRIIKKAVRRKR